jgi:medium-chain acyl-[acyl-carrier-protein] hydrolase
MPSWIVVPKPRPASAIKVFGVPHAGRGASLFYPWASRLPEWVELSAVQLPGRETRISERPLTCLEDILEGILAEIAPQLDRPYVLFGHSMGALICFELARALRRRGAPLPIGLFVSGRRAPSLPNPDGIIHTLADQDFVDELTRRYNGIPQVVREHPEMMRVLVPIMRSDLTVIETYSFVAQPPLDLPVFLYGGRDDVQMTPASIEAWRAISAGDLTLRLFPGGHFYLQDDRERLLDVLAVDLAWLRAQERAGYGASEESGP